MTVRAGVFSAAWLVAGLAFGQTGEDASGATSATLDAESARVEELERRAREREAYTRAKLAEVFSPSVNTATWALDATAGARAEYTGERRDTAGAEATLSASADLEAAYGRYSSRLATDALARFALSGDAPPISLAHHAFVRPWEFGMMRLELDQRFQWNERPALSSRRDVWRRPYSREDLRVMFTMLHWRFARFGFQVARLEEAPTWIWQRDGAAEKKQFELRSDYSLFWLERRAPRQAGKPARRDLAINLFFIQQEAIKGQDEATVTQMGYARATGVPLGIPGLYADGAVGTSSVTPYLRVSGSFGSTMVITEDLPLFDVTTGYGRVYGILGPISLELSAERALYLTFDSELALEDRARAQFGTRVRATEIEVAAFAAATTTWSSVVDAQRARTGGASLTLRRPLDRNLTLGVYTEVARSFYASLAGERTPTPTLGVRTGLSLETSFGRTHTLR